MTEIDVRVQDVWKQYRLSPRRHAPTFWALQGVTLDVPRGSATGIIGRNGAGKSTLLKLLAGITAPTRGRIVLQGRLAALIEVGSGFHPELTGRENVFLSGAILGMSRRDIVAKLPSIIEFAGVETFIDTPVKWYSSGMYVRLGFSIAAHLNPDILLVDEVLAVGDADFQAKCLQRVRELKARGVTIVFISHDLTAVEQLCDRAVLLESGQVSAMGDPASVVAAYHQRLTGAAVTDAYPAIAREGALKLTNLTIETPNGTSANTGEPVTIVLRYRASRPVRAEFELSYYSADGRTLIAKTRTEGGIEVWPAGGAVEFSCPMLPLAPGTYYVGATVREAGTGNVIDWWDGGTMLHVGPGSTGPVGQVLIPHDWHVVHETVLTPTSV
jgi:lipopolysaccharide transport system ATP-binding protein